MDSHKEGQLDAPSQLINKVEIHVRDYIPHRTITEKMVQREISAVKGSSIEDGWELYARLAILQAFDNGNKRTALISVNLLIGALKDETQTILTIICQTFSIPYKLLYNLLKNIQFFYLYKKHFLIYLS